jgi:hypothetical protein
LFTSHPHHGFSRSHHHHHPLSRSRRSTSTTPTLCPPRRLRDEQRSSAAIQVSRRRGQVSVTKNAPCFRIRDLPSCTHHLPITDGFSRRILKMQNVWSVFVHQTPSNQECQSVPGL